MKQRFSGALLRNWAVFYRHLVGRTPWSAAAAHVGFLDLNRGPRGTREDQGVRPTKSLVAGEDMQRPRHVGIQRDGPQIFKRGGLI